MFMYSQQKKTEKFSERFRTRAARLGLAANEIAEKMGVEPSAVSNWMNGANLPKAKNMRDLAALLGCDIDWLLGMDTAQSLNDAPMDVAGWQRRALAAEQKLEVIRAVISPLNDEAMQAAEELLRMAEAQAAQESRPSPATKQPPHGALNYPKPPKAS